MCKHICNNIETLINKVNYNYNKPFNYRLINFDINDLYKVLSAINEYYQVYLVIDYNRVDNFNSLKVYRETNNTEYLKMNLKYDINQNIRSFCNVINKVNNIKYLIFKNYLNNKSIDIFGEALQNNNSIEFLDLSDYKNDLNFLNSVIDSYEHFNNYTSLISSLSINKSLTSLDLSGNDFDNPNGFTEAFINNNFLINLDISYTNLSAENVSNILSNCTNLSTLMLYNKYCNKYNYSINNNNINTIFDSLKNNTTLQTLSLDCAGISDLNPLTKALINNNTLHSLYLYNIRLCCSDEEFIKSKNLKVIINLIENNNNINTLHINKLYCCDWRQIGGIYNKLLTEALNKNTTLTDLNYW